MKKKKHGEIAREEILEAGLKLWHYDPTKISTRNIAKVIGKTHTAVFYHFPNGVKKAVAAYGVQKNDSIVIVSLILTNDPLVRNMSDKDKQKHLNAVKSISPK